LDLDFVSLLISILSIFLCFVPGLGLALGITGAALSYYPRHKPGSRRGLAVVGITCGCIGAVAGLFMTLIPIAP
jgi:hypothetical protein